MMRPEEATGERPTSGALAPPSSPLEDALTRARAHLLGLQHADGHWCGRLEGSSILESEYVLLEWYLGRGGGERVAHAAEGLRRAQAADGGWPSYPGGPADVSTSVKAYFALKLAGEPPTGAALARARLRIRELGGLSATNSFTKLYLALFGQWSWSACPVIPPELLLLPPGAPLSIYEMSAWSRAMVVPLSVLSALRPVRAVPEWAAIGELANEAPVPGPPSGVASDPWRRFFLGLDRVLQYLERAPVKPLRAHALGRAEAWILEHMEASDGIGAIFPPIVNSLLALSALGYRPDHPAMVRQQDALERLLTDDGSTLRVEPCHGPVWDTALALRALLELPGGETSAAVRRGAEWLLAREVRRAGDWSVRRRGVPPGGWYFQYENERYPDADDTAQVLADLYLLDHAAPLALAHGRPARQRALDWLLAMQNPDGGWAAFDRGCTRPLLTHVPFADHNAMLDPSCPDITGRALEALALAGLGREHRAVRRAVRYLATTQEPDGAWLGRWGVSYVYGTALALRGLGYAGEDMRGPTSRRGADWLRDHQHPSGAWGESPATYDHPEQRGAGPATATQTAWALLGVLAAGDVRTPAVERGVRWLLAAQNQDGTWTDEHWTGTGFPRVFYLRYELYERYFPLLALATYRRLGGEV